MNALTVTALEPPAVPPPDGFHGAVSDFKRRLIEATLRHMQGNRTHTARALGLQRTYLLRLIRDFGVDVPPPPRRRASWCRDHAASPVVTQRLGSSR
jgi:DNA-binding NtrC family response regulator